MRSGRRKGALVGFGFIAEHGHLPAYLCSEELEIVAVADICANRRAAAARALPNARIYDDHTSLLGRERRGLDFVDITAPPYAHASVATDALAQRLHVLCEKPLTTNVADARSLCALAQAQHCVLFPAHNYRHAPVIKAVRNVLESGSIGDVHMLTLSTFRHTHARGVPEWNEHWRRERRYSGGGIAMDHGSHTFYLAFEWLRSYPTSIVAKLSTTAAYDTEDNVYATLTFPTGIATTQLSWTAGVRKVIYTLHGTRGALRVEDDELEVSTMLTGSAQQQVRWQRTTERVPSAWMDASHAGWFASLLHEFARAIDERAYFGKDAQDAVRCVEVINGAYASSADSSREYALHNAL